MACVHKILGKTGIFPLRFVSTDSLISTPLVVQIPTATVPDVMYIVYLEDQTPLEVTAGRNSAKVVIVP